MLDLLNTKNLENCNCKGLLNTELEISLDKNTVDLNRIQKKFQDRHIGRDIPFITKKYLETINVLTDLAKQDVNNKIKTLNCFN